MLGVAAHIQRAGWAQSSAADLVGEASIQVLTAAVTQDNMFVRPSRYADFSTISALGNQGAGLNLSGAAGSFDMTGIGTQNRRQLDALTFRVGNNWLADAEQFLAGGGVNNIYNNDGAQEFRGVNWSNQGPGEFGGYTFTAGGAGISVKLSHETMDLFRNRWLTFIAASSDNQADFASWSGFDSPNSHSWAFRLMLLDVSSAEIIGSADGWSFRASGPVDLTQDWQHNSNSDYVLDHGIFIPNDSLSQLDIEFAAYQHIMGSTADPADPSVRFDLMGTGFNTETQGLRPMVGWTFDSEGTAVTGDTGETNGFQQPIPNWSRLPSARTVIISGDFFQDPAEAPEFISF